MAEVVTTTSWNSFVDVIFSSLLAPCWKVFETRTGETVSPRENQYSLAIILLSFSTGEFFLHRTFSHRTSPPHKKSTDILSEENWDLSLLRKNAEQVRHRIAHGGFVEEDVSWSANFQQSTHEVRVVSDSRGVDKKSRERSYFKNAGLFCENLKMCGFEEALKHLYYLSAVVEKVTADFGTSSSIRVFVPRDGIREGDIVPWQESLNFWREKVKESKNKKAEENLESFLASEIYRAAIAAASSNFTERRAEPVAPAVTP